MCICLVDVLSHGLCLSLPWLCTLVPALRDLTNKTNKIAGVKLGRGANNIQIIVELKYMTTVKAFIAFCSPFTCFYDLFFIE